MSRDGAEKNENVSGPWISAFANPPATVNVPKKTTVKLLVPADKCTDLQPASVLFRSFKECLIVVT